MSRTRTPRRLLAGAAGALAISLAAGACDTSPVAASVNGADIQQTALNRELQSQTSNKAYVESVDQAAAGSTTNASITGDAPGTYSAPYVAAVLTQLVEAKAVHQKLDSEGRQPGSEELAAARATDEALFGSTWLSFPSSFRDAQVRRDAEHAMIEPDPSDPSQLKSAYDSVSRFFFSQVCVRSVAVSVRGADGNVDFPASLREAKGVAANYNLGQSSLGAGSDQGTVTGGRVDCFDGAGLEAEGHARFDLITSLAPHQAAEPIQTSFGYQVLAVESREPLPFDAVTQKALAVGIIQAQHSTDPGLDAVMRKAHVSVDPAYGTWDAQRSAVVPASPLGANSSSVP